MKLNIKEQVVADGEGHMYEVVCLAMYGDMDSFETVVMSGFGADYGLELLEDFLNVCERMKSEDLYEGTFNHVEGYKKWFAIDEVEAEEFEGLPDQLKAIVFTSDDWPYDVMADREPKMWKYDVFYYDKKGIKYNVDVVFE